LKSVFYIADKYVYPSLRRLLVLRLRSKGARPAEIARLLGLSRSLVTRYLKGERGKYIDFTMYKDVVSVLDSLADTLLSGKIGAEEAVLVLSGLTMYVLGKRYVCSLHAEIDDVDPSKCGLCPRLFSNTGLEDLLLLTS